MEEQDSITDSTQWPHLTRNITESANNDTNGVQYPSKLMDAAATCYAIFTIVGISGNFISILALAKCPKLRNATTAFVINLAVADLIFCSFSSPLQAATFASRHRAYGDGALCTLFAFVSYHNVLVSLFTVVAITVNRYICIVHPTWYAGVYKPRNVAVMIVTIWISASVVLSFPLFHVWGRFGPIPQGMSCDMLKLNGKSPKVIVFLTILLIPTVSFIICYSRIYFVVRNAAAKVQSSDVSKTARDEGLADASIASRIRRFIGNLRCLVRRWSTDPMEETATVKKRAKDLKVLKMVLVIFISYVVCYFPLSLLKVVKKSDAGHVFFVVAYLMAYLANCINPVIYVAMSREYRKAYFRLFGCRKDDIYPTSTDTRDTQDVSKEPSAETELTSMCNNFSCAH